MKAKKFISNHPLLVIYIIFALTSTSLVIVIKETPDLDFTRYIIVLGAHMMILIAYSIGIIMLAGFIEPLINFKFYDYYRDYIELKSSEYIHDFVYESMTSTLDDPIEDIDDIQKLNSTLFDYKRHCVKNKNLSRLIEDILIFTDDALKTYSNLLNSLESENSKINTIKCIFEEVDIKKDELHKYVVDCKRQKDNVENYLSGFISKLNEIQESKHHLALFFIMLAIQLINLYYIIFKDISGIGLPFVT